MNELNKKLFIAFLIIFSLGMIALLVINTATNSKIQDLSPKYDVPNFELTNFNGDIFTDNDLINKITIVSFIFTRCEGACPIMSKNFRDLQTSFKDSDLVQFVSITVDPEYDSDSILKSFSNQYSNNDSKDYSYYSKLNESFTQIIHCATLLFIVSVPVYAWFWIIDSLATLVKLYVHS